MRYKYCPECGEKLGKRPVGDEGELPYCTSCNRPWFDTFSSCVLSVVVNEDNEVLLIRQSYGDTSRFVDVAGFMKCGEAAEDSAAREIKEETGLDCESVRFIKSIFYDGRDQLMLGFLARVKKSELSISSELLEGRWFDIDTAVNTVRQGSIIQELIIGAKDILNENCR